MHSEPAVRAAQAYALIGDRDATALAKLLRDSTSAKRGAPAADAIFADFDDLQ